MAEISAKKRIWGWMLFDWASQPYNTLLLTFIFGPYFTEMVIGIFTESGMDVELAKAKAQAYWGWGLTATGLLIAVSAPVLGAFADSSGKRMMWIKIFSIFYVVGAFGLWWTSPQDFSILWALVFFGIGFIGMEFVTIFTNSMLPSLVPIKDTGRVSGSAFALGYWGGVLALAIMLPLFVENADGVTLVQKAPILGLDATLREGTRFVGPFTAIWFMVGMIPFFLWVREKPSEIQTGATISDAMKALGNTIKTLPQNRSMFSFLTSSLFYRDALNGLYAFGAIYAHSVLDWSITLIGVFGVVSAITAAIFSYFGGILDQKKGPKPILTGSILALIAVCIIVVSMTRESLFGIAFAPDSSMADIIFFVCGGVIGAAGGMLQSSSRSMMVRQADPARPTEAFGLYALSGKATAFLAPALIAIASELSGDPRIGISPLIFLFGFSLVLLLWVKPNGVYEEI